MNDSMISRRDLFALSSTALLATTAHAAPSHRHAATSGVPAALAEFIPLYMRAMNAPGLSLALANASGPVGLGAYGYENIAARREVTLAHRFEIGSVTKSFAGLVVLQLQDEGLLDVQHPILRYLPWLALEASFGEIRIHHLLTHTAGMPDDPPAIPIDPKLRVRQMCAPGTRFSYSNWGYEVLGYLIEAVDGRPWPTAVAHRILRPLGMTDTVAAINNAQRGRIAQSYVPLHDDRPFPRHGALTPARAITFETAAGSIASTPADMALYMRMLLRRGVGPTGRIVSPQAFEMFVTPYVPAPPFGSGAGYGYGIAIDRLDGRVRLRHTGGMDSFMSSLQVDLDAGFGAFASINAQLGYRPNPVTEYALRVLRAGTQGAPVPKAPAVDEAAHVTDPTAYTGTYVAADGRRLEVHARGHRLELIRAGTTIALQQAGSDQFIADHPDLALFAIAFLRAQHVGAEPKVAPPVVELVHGANWYGRDGVAAEPAPKSAIDLTPYCGTYCGTGTLSGIVRVVERRGRLWLNGTNALDPDGPDAFVTVEEAPAASRIEFRARVGGKAQAMVVADGGLFDTGVIRRIHNLDGLES